MSYRPDDTVFSCLNTQVNPDHTKEIEMKIKTSELTDAALDWAVAKTLGYTMREPVRGTNEQARGLSVPFTMFEVNYQQTSEFVNERCWVSPVTVTRFGVNHAWGATAESIDFTGSDGRKASGSVDLFYFDQAEAELEVNGAMNGYAEGFEPSTNWAQGGPLLNHPEIGVVAQVCDSDQFCAYVVEGDAKKYYCADTMLEAICIAFVALKVGEEVEVPKELQ